MLGLLVVLVAWYAYEFYQRKQAETASGPAAPQAETQSQTNPARDAAPAAVEPAPVRRPAPAGTFYMLERVSISNDEGTSGIDPGTEVKLVEDKGNVKIVTDGKNKYEVTAKQITDDMNVADQLRKSKLQAIQAHIKALTKQEAGIQKQIAAINAAIKKQRDVNAGKPGNNDIPKGEQELQTLEALDTGLKAQIGALQRQASASN